LVKLEIPWVSGLWFWQTYSQFFVPTVFSQTVLVICIHIKVDCIQKLVFEFPLDTNLIKKAKKIGVLLYKTFPRMLVFVA